MTMAMRKRASTDYSDFYSESPLGVGVINRSKKITPITPASALARGAPPAHLVASVMANIAMCAVVATLAWLSFHRQELAGATE
jgi:hypothetical protein